MPRFPRFLWLLSGLAGFCAVSDYRVLGHYDVTVIDPATGDITAIVPLAAHGKLEQNVFDGNSRMFLNNEEANLVHVVNLQRLKTVARWPLASGTSRTGLGIDTVHRRLFAACNNNRLIVLDSDNGSVIATIAIRAGPDGVAFNASTRLIYSSNVDGTLTVIHKDTPDRYTDNKKFIDRSRLPHAGAGCEPDRIFLPTTSIVPRPAEKFAQRRGSGRTDGFKILVVGR